MTRDELREKVAHAIAASSLAGPRPEYTVADAVMPVLAEALAGKDAEIAELHSLLRARDENLHVEAEGWKDIVAALGAQEAQAKTERDLALWLHAEALAGKDAEFTVEQEATGSGLTWRAWDDLGVGSREPGCARPALPFMPRAEERSERSAPRRLV